MHISFFYCTFAQLILHETEGTYLAWVNIEALGMSAEALNRLKDFIKA